MPERFASINDSPIASSERRVLRRWQGGGDFRLSTRTIVRVKFGYYRTGERSFSAYEALRRSLV